MEMILVLVLVVAIPAAVAAAYVIVRDKHHPVDHPLKGDDQGWGNNWPK